MEPITTVSLMLAASLICAPKTATPRWTGAPMTSHWIDLDESVKELFVGISTVAIAAPAAVIALAPTSTEVKKIAQVTVQAAPDLDKKERLYASLIRFLPALYKGDPAAASTEEDIVTAIRLIRSLPSGIPLPKIMRNEDGEIGMYWDDDDVYIDVNIEAGGKLSLFSRVRSANEERFVSEIDVNDLNAEWAREHLSSLRHRIFVG